MNAKKLIPRPESQHPTTQENSGLSATWLGLPGAHEPAQGFCTSRHENCSLGSPEDSRCLEPDF